jgi:hypothetical protein
MACSVCIIFTFTSCSLLLLCFQAQGAATSVPHQLYGKSVTISESGRLVYEDETTGQIKTLPFENTISFYFSSLGRIFARRLARLSRSSRTYEQIGSDPNKVQRATSATGSGQRPFGTFSTFQDLHFEGRTLVAINSTGENGARRLAVEFDQSFSACTVSGSRGTDNGKPERKIGWSGSVQRVISRQQTYSCGLRDGNIFE